MDFRIDISKPANADDFEEFCLEIYRAELQDPTATRNGRSGQKQAGVDIFATRATDGRLYGIQCKRINYSTLDFETVEEEVDLADKGKQDIDELVVATTAPNDAKVTREVRKLNAARKKAGKFEVKVAFWGTLENLVRAHQQLLRKYAPNAPGVNQDAW